MATPSGYRTITVARGLAYNVYYTPAAASGKSTLLFLHGFPSTSYEWRKQLPHFEALGYGVVAPDLLGAGGTAKPADVQAFRHAAMAQDIIDVLDALGLARVVGVAQDWGSVLLSQLAVRHQGRFSGFVWLGLGYLPAQPVLPLAEGQTPPGYWGLFTRPDAAELIEKNVDSFIQLVYPKDPSCWLTWFFQDGKAAECVEKGILLGRAEWLSDEEYDALKANFLSNGLKSPLMWYVSEVAGVNREDILNIPAEALRLNVPVLYVGASKDVICLESATVEQMGKYAETLQTASLPAGHWLQVEQADELNKILGDWLAMTVL